MIVGVKIRNLKRLPFAEMRLDAGFGDGGNLAVQVDSVMEAVGLISTEKCHHRADLRSIMRKQKLYPQKKLGNLVIFQRNNNTQNNISSIRWKSDRQV
jgi:hypothetical protein